MPTLDGKQLVRRYVVRYGKCEREGCDISKKIMFIFHKREWGVFCSTNCFIRHHRIDRNKVEIIPVKPVR